MQIFNDPFLVSCNNYQYVLKFELQLEKMIHILTNRKDNEQVLALSFSLVDHTH